MLHLSDIAILLVVAAGLWALYYYVGGGKARQDMKKRVMRLRERKSPIVKPAQDMSVRRKTAEVKGLVYWLSKPLPDFKRLGDKLERAGKNISTKQYILRRVLGMLIILFAVSGILHKPVMLGICAAIVLGLWLPLKWLQRTINKQNKAFLKLFPDAIDLIVRGLRSGLPVSESMVVVSQEIAEPVAGVFSNIADTMKLGVTMERALQETARKLDMTEFNFFTTSIVLQRETGGNLSEILSNLSEVLRGRFIMRMKITALSSEARASAYIIGALPFVVLLAISILSPHYITPLYHDSRGTFASMVAVGMLCFGGFVMYRMTQFEI